MQALNEHKSEVRVQFKSPVEVPGTNMQMDKIRNELVFRLQPDEAIYLKMALKEPGLGMTPIISELDLTYRVRKILKAQNPSRNTLLIKPGLGITPLVSELY